MSIWESGGEQNSSNFETSISISSCSP